MGGDRDMNSQSPSKTIENVMQRYPRHEVIRFCLTLMSVGELLLAVLQRLALHAIRADYASGNNHPAGVPLLNPSFAIHGVDSSPVGTKNKHYAREPRRRNAQNHTLD